MKSKTKENVQKGEKNEKMEESGNGWRLERIGGSTLSLHRPVFDSRNERLMCASGGDVLMIEVQTGTFIGKLEHSETVVALHFSPDTEQHLVTCTNRGDLYVWDIGTRTVLKYHKLPAVEVYAMATLKLTYVLALGNDSDKGPKLFMCERVNSAMEQPQWTTVVETNSSENALPTDERMIAFSDALVVWCCKKQVHGRLLKGSGESSKNSKRLPMSYTCSEKYDRVVDNDLLKFESVAVHAATDSVAAGLSTGKIFLWYNVSNVGLTRPNQFVHWQKSPVMDLVFTHEGTSLLSGGGETVLVKYTLHSAGQPTRQFLARVGGGILRVALSNDNSRCALVLDDNSVQIVHTIVMNVIASAQGLVKSRLSPSIGLKIDSAGAAGPRTLGSILTNGRPGHVQFFDPVEAMHIFSVDVSGQNLPDADRHLYGETHTWSEVIRASTAKHWLATLECRSDALQTHLEELYLKFWHFDTEQNRFSLHTIVDYPHSGVVTDFEFRPSADCEPCLLTAGKDGKLKIWTLDDDNKAWQCERVLTYQGLPANAFAFSARSAALATGFGDAIALWQNENWKLLAAAQVFPSDINYEIKQILWGIGTHEHMLVVSTDRAVIAWDTRSLSAVWAVGQKNAAMLAVDPTSGLFAALSGVHLFLFTPTSPEPLLTYLFPTAQDAACWVPPIALNPNQPRLSEFSGQMTTLNSRLFVMSERRELSALVPPLSRSQRSAKRKQLDEAPESKSTALESTTPFSELLREERMSQSTVSAEQRKTQRDHAGNVQLLAAPAHTLPAVDVLAPAFIRSCLIRKDDAVR